MLRFVAPAAVLAIIAVIAAASSGPPISAQTDPIVSVDAVSDGGNTATAVGTINGCLSTTTGATFDVDVVIQGVTNLAGFQADLLYNALVLKVTAVNYNFLLGSTGAAVLDLGNSTPDTDGDFFMAAAMFSLSGITGASGDGVLARLTLTAVGSGSSALDLTKVKLSDASGNPIPPTDANNFYIGPVNDAGVAVDISCSTDSDGDTVPDVSDNCPAWPNADQSLPPWTVPSGDPDCDGFNTTVETFVGTLALAHCALTPDTNDEDPDSWPVDFNDDQGVNIFDVLTMKPRFNKVSPDPDYSARHDLDTDGDVDIFDVLRIKPFFFQSCT